MFGLSSRTDEVKDRKGSRFRTRHHHRGGQVLPRRKSPAAGPRTSVPGNRPFSVDDGQAAGRSRGLAGARTLYFGAGLGSAS